MKDFASWVGSATLPAASSSNAANAWSLKGTKDAMLRRHAAPVLLRVNPATKRTRLVSARGGT